MDKQGGNDSEEAERYPKSLIESYNAAFASGKYVGSLSEYVSVSYLIFRTRYASQSEREPPGRDRWLRSLFAFQEDCDEAEKVNLKINIPMHK